MKSTKFISSIQRRALMLVDRYPIVKDISQSIYAAGGRCYIVGGAVRDVVLDRRTKDLDIEIHGLKSAIVENILSEHGAVSLVGKVFGVFRVHGSNIDWSLPRTDSVGRKPDVVIDPDMTIEKALLRRDLTMNAMAIEIGSYELIDPFGGLDDIKKNILRTPDPAFFVEDPLRFYRVMQFVSRFDMLPDEQLNVVCKKMDVKSVAVERIDEEFRKMLLRSQRPSAGLRWIKSIERMRELLPELSALINLPQHSKWHPEGDAFEHTMQAVDAAVRFEYDSIRTELIVLFAALCHDLGKAVTTKKLEGQWRSFGHSKAGVKLTINLLKRITRDKMLIKSVCKLVRYHMSPIQFVEDGAKLSAYKRLARKLAPDANLEMLAKLALADQQAKSSQGLVPLECDDGRIDAFLEKAQQAKVLLKTEEPVLQGRDLLDVVEPGPEMGKILKKAYELQIEEEITDKDELKRRTLKNMLDK